LSDLDESLESSLLNLVEVGKSSSLGPVQKVLRSGDAQTRNETKRAAIQTRVDEAQAARLAYLDQVK
jgi:hypothetical protein